MTLDEVAGRVMDSMMRFCPKAHIGPGYKDAENVPSARPYSVSRPAAAAALPEALANQAGHVPPVRPALALTHHVSDQRADRAHVARADLFGRGGVRSDRPVHT